MTVSKAWDAALLPLFHPGVPGVISPAELRKLKRLALGPPTWGRESRGTAAVAPAPVAASSPSPAAAAASTTPAASEEDATADCLRHPTLPPPNPHSDKVETGDKRSQHTARSGFLLPNRMLPTADPATSIRTALTEGLLSRVKDVIARPCDTLFTGEYPIDGNMVVGFNHLDQVFSDDGRNRLFLFATSDPVEVWIGRLLRMHLYTRGFHYKSASDVVPTFTNTVCMAYRVLMVIKAVEARAIALGESPASNCGPSVVEALAFAQSESTLSSPEPPLGSLSQEGCTADVSNREPSAGIRAIEARAIAQGESTLSSPEPPLGSLSGEGRTPDTSNRELSAGIIVVEARAIASEESAACSSGPSEVITEVEARNTALGKSAATQEARLNALSKEDSTAEVSLAAWRAPATAGMLAQLAWDVHRESNESYLQMSQALLAGSGATSLPTPAAGAQELLLQPMSREAAGSGTLSARRRSGPPPKSAAALPPRLPKSRHAGRQPHAGEDRLKLVLSVPHEQFPPSLPCE
jgi:hypothetical protein